MKRVSTSGFGPNADMQQRAETERSFVALLICAVAATGTASAGLLLLEISGFYLPTILALWLGIMIGVVFGVTMALPQNTNSN